MAEFVRVPLLLDGGEVLFVSAKERDVLAALSDDKIKPLLDKGLIYVERNEGELGFMADPEDFPAKVVISREVSPMYRGMIIYRIKKKV